MIISLPHAPGPFRTRYSIQHALPNADTINHSIGQWFQCNAWGTLIIETVFSIPGIGTYMMSYNNRDYPVVQAVLLS